jgi:hypothetical protein
VLVVQEKTLIIPHPARSVVVGEADPLHVLITIKFIRIGKWVANQLHIIAIAKLLSARARQRVKTARWRLSTVMVRSGVTVDERARRWNISTLSFSILTVLMRGVRDVRRKRRPGQLKGRENLPNRQIPD